MDPCIDVGGSAPPLTISMYDQEPMQTTVSYRGHRSALNIWLSRVIGSSPRSTVVSAEWCDGGADAVAVVVKVLSHALSPAQKKAILIPDLARAAADALSIDHPHVLPFLGTCEIGSWHLGLLVPRMLNGNIMQYVSQNPSLDRLRLLRQAFQGLDYLHTERNIVHGNIRSTNVLISAEGNALLADACLNELLAPFIDHERAIPNIHFVIALAYRPPESLRSESDSDSLPTKASDVYALGTVVYEVFMGALPWAEATPKQRLIHQLAGDPPPQIASNDAAWELCIACWTPDPDNRPTSRGLLSLLA
ncbi:kinase-like protein [Auricularia subglabra TFB-10046 SS5]|nr:kinase-like protein [Auricularia subglabra TFB-10046 SS5]